jgi:hypothetical protein
MEIYNKLPTDLQEEVDTFLFKNQKIIQKQTINNINFIDRLIREELHSIPYSYDTNERQLIDFLCWYIFRPRLYGQGYCGCDSDSGEYEYKICRKNKTPLHKFLKKWLRFLQTEKNKPSFEDLYEEIRLSLDNWVVEKITDKQTFQDYALDLGFNIAEMYETYIITYGMDDIQDIDFNMFYKSVFTAHLCDKVEIIIMKSYDYELETDTSDSDTE